MNQRRRPRTMTNSPSCIRRRAKRPSPLPGASCIDTSSSVSGGVSARAGFARYASTAAAAVPGKAAMRGCPIFEPSKPAAALKHTVASARQANRAAMKGWSAPAGGETVARFVESGCIFELCAACRFLSRESQFQCELLSQQSTRKSCASGCDCCALRLVPKKDSVWTVALQL